MCDNLQWRICSKSRIKVLFWNMTLIITASVIFCNQEITFRWMRDHTFFSLILKYDFDNSTQWYSAIKKLLSDEWGITHFSVLFWNMTLITAAVIFCNQEIAFRWMRDPTFFSFILKYDSDNSCSNILQSRNRFQMNEGSHIFQFYSEIWHW